MTSDVFRPFWTPLSTLSDKFLNYKVRFWGSFRIPQPPTYPKIGRHLWTSSYTILMIDSDHTQLYCLLLLKFRNALVMYVAAKVYTKLR